MHSIVSVCLFEMKTNLIFAHAFPAIGLALQAPVGSHLVQGGLLDLCLHILLSRRVIP